MSFSLLFFPFRFERVESFGFAHTRLSFLVSFVSCRYAYFKRLDYFSTECIYSPDGEISSLPFSLLVVSAKFEDASLSFLSLSLSDFFPFRFVHFSRSLPRTCPSLSQRPRSHPSVVHHRHHQERGDVRSCRGGQEGDEGSA